MLEVFDWTYAYRKSMVVDTACELDVFTRLEERAQSAERRFASSLRALGLVEHTL